MHLKYCLIRFECKIMNELRLKSANILIIDDQQPNVDLLEGFLEMEGFRNIKSTIDSREALSLFHTFSPDLILLDLAMPYFSGFEIMDQLKPFIDSNTFLPILVLSANITTEAKQRALAEGASDFLSKPFDLIEVWLRIRNLLYSRFLHLQLMDQNQHLEEKVRERTAELEKIAIDLLAAKNKAEASDRLKTSFLQTISHEIRTPMNGVLGFASLLASTDLGEDEKQEYLKMMETSANRLINTITDYVQISLITSGNLEVKLQPVRLSHLLSEAENKYHKICQDKGLTFTLLIPENSSDFILESDPELLRIVISHIVANAIKFTSKGNVTLGIHIYQSKIECYVKDSGIGINEDTQKQIFESFVQGDGSNTRTFEGSGLGLSIVQGILRHLGSEIQLNSELGKGSTFYFTLPF